MKIWTATVCVPTEQKYIAYTSTLTTDCNILSFLCKVVKQKHKYVLDLETVNIRSITAADKTKANRSKTTLEVLLK